MFGMIIESSVPPTGVLPASAPCAGYCCRAGGCGWGEPAVACPSVGRQITVGRVGLELSGQREGA